MCARVILQVLLCILQLLLTSFHRLIRTAPRLNFSVAEINANELNNTQYHLP